MRTDRHRNFSIYNDIYIKKKLAYIVINNLSHGSPLSFAYSGDDSYSGLDNVHNPIRTSNENIGLITRITYLKVVFYRMH